MRARVLAKSVWIPHPPDAFDESPRDFVAQVVELVRAGQARRDVPLHALRICTHGAREKGTKRTRKIRKRLVVYMQQRALAASIKPCIAVVQ